MTKKIFQLIFLLLISAGISGCSLIRRGIAELRSTSQFVPLETDKRVLYEPGAKELAAQVAADLPGSIAKVEHELYRPFVMPVFVYVCDSEENFSKYTGVSGPRGVLTTRVFLSGKLKKPEFNNTIQAILTHELSHLHLAQQLGSYRVNTHLPAWFQEGLGVFVSNGGGAETVSEAEAAKVIIAGKCITPEEKGSFFFKKNASSYGLSAHMFYRQSGMFIAYLKNLDDGKFRSCMLAIGDGNSFKDSFTSAFGMNVHEAWQKYVEQLKNINF